jgi:hypothetical protein
MPSVLRKRLGILWPTLYFFWCNNPQCTRDSSFTRFLNHTRRHTTDGRTLGEGLACFRDRYLTTHNRQTSVFPVGFKPTIPAGERQQTYALDRVATGTDWPTRYFIYLFTYMFYILLNLGTVHIPYMPLVWLVTIPAVFILLCPHGF